MAETQEPFELRRFFYKLQQKPGGVGIFLTVVALGLVLLLSGKEAEKEPKLTRSLSNENEVMPTVARDLARFETHLEKEMVRILQAINGAGRVSVKITLKSGVQQVWERQTRVSRRTERQQQEVITEESSDEQLAFTTSKGGGNAPVLKTELAPEIEGIVVVATGAVNGQVKELLTETVMTVLNLPVHRVLVVAGKELR